jgi:hypothetical protein
VDLVAAVGAEEQPAAVVQPGECALDDPTFAAEPVGFANSACQVKSVGLQGGSDCGRAGGGAVRLGRESLWGLARRVSCLF